MVVGVMVIGVMVIGAMIPAGTMILTRNRVLGRPG